MVHIGVNTHKTNPRFTRIYPDGTCGSHMHAEMNALRFAQPGDVLRVMRFNRSNLDFNMAKPCEHCQEHIKNADLKKVYYTDWNGRWQKLRL